MDSFDDRHRYIMKDYDQLKPCSNFLSGVGGVWGIPMWSFFVNRAQGMASFGIQNKDGPMMRFQTAEKSYQNTPLVGFRTMLRAVRGGKTFELQPFLPTIDSIHDTEQKRTMFIGKTEMEVQEVDHHSGVQTNALFFVVPNEEFPTMVRQTTFTNIGEDDLELEVLDGLCQMQPYGIHNDDLNAIGRTMEAFMNVYNVPESNLTQPFFHVSQGAADTAEVKVIDAGHFMCAFIDDASSVGPDGLHTLLPVIVDPSVVFAQDTTLLAPRTFFSKKVTIEGLIAMPQGTMSRTPCAFSASRLKIPKGGKVTITSMYGHAANLELYQKNIAPIIRKPGFATAKREEAQGLTSMFSDKVATETSVPIFDEYVKSNYHDNVLRGGMPFILGGAGSPKVFHTFSRVHGDLERDYNDFQIDLTYYSQGPGNFRDVNQNRREDVTVFPEIGDYNVRVFLSLVQSDGYNPLVVANPIFKVDQAKVGDIIARHKLPAKVAALLSTPFRPGELFRNAIREGVSFAGVNKEALLNEILDASVSSQVAKYKQNGFWSDHWTYTLDLIENHTSIFPEKEQSLLWDSEPLPFFLSPAVVAPRDQRYSLNAKGQVRQYSAVIQRGEPGWSREREQALLAATSAADYLQDRLGNGGVWQRAKDGSIFGVTVVAKLAMLGMIKFATLDPSGMGVEYEAGKPGWNDAMNGLPGILGSGMPETCEMLRILTFVRRRVNKYGRSIVFPTEFSQFLNDVGAALDTNLAVTAPTEKDDFTYWDACSSARERYFVSVAGAFAGTTVEWDVGKLDAILGKMETKARAGVARAVKRTGGVIPCFIYHDVTKSETVKTGADKPPIVRPQAFSPVDIPLFLEGPVRHMKVVEDMAERREIYEKVKASNLFDKKLSMYLICESLKEMSPELGRMKAFSPGWLENESIWLHMSYKWYLEVLRAGLYEEFYTEIKTGLVPFLDPQTYGRSPLEASSFIVSSSFPDANLHGVGFCARLTGSTVEFISMWAIMMTGGNPFVQNEQGELVLRLAPKLPSWMFTAEGTVTFTFLGKIKVKYCNPSKANTWTLAASRSELKMPDGTVQTVEGQDIPTALALAVRQLKVDTITVQLA